MIVVFIEIFVVIISTITVSKEREDEIEKDIRRRKRVRGLRDIATGSEIDLFC